MALFGCSMILSYRSIFFILRSPRFYFLVLNHPFVQPQTFFFEVAFYYKTRLCENIFGVVALIFMFSVLVNMVLVGQYTVTQLNTKPILKMKEYRILNYVPETYNFPSMKFSRQFKHFPIYMQVFSSKLCISIPNILEWAIKSD